VVMGCDEPLMGSRQLCLSAEETLFGKIQYVGSWMRPRPSSYLNINRNIYGGYPTTKPSPENAVDFIVRQVKANPHQVTLFVIGPATNIALAVKKNPEIVPLIKKVIYMGGVTKIEERYLVIDTNYGPNYGRTIEYFETPKRSYANPANFPVGTQKVKILYDIDRDLFWNLYIKLVTKK
jgi:inosine-uridine nucleoside N-ribohydrolase